MLVETHTLVAGREKSADDHEPLTAVMRPGGGVGGEGGGGEEGEREGKGAGVEGEGGGGRGEGGGRRGKSAQLVDFCKSPIPNSNRVKDHCKI